jgi:hypothetical protein
MRGEQSEGEKDPTMWLDVALGLQKIDKFEKSGPTATMENLVSEFAHRDTVIDLTM